MTTLAQNENDRALLDAVSRNDPAAVQQLLAAGANADVADGSGETAVQIAMRLGYDKVANALILAGATLEDDPNEETPGLDDIPMEEAKSLMAAEYLRLRSLLFPLEHHADPPEIVVEVVNEGDVNVEWGYNYETHTVRLVIHEGELQASRFREFDENANPSEIYAICPFISPWRVFLAHELCHDYQWRVLQDRGDQRGAELLALRIRPWPGPGHTPAFCNAIEAFGRRFGIAAETLVKEF